MQTLDVFLSGRVLPGADTQKAVAALAEMAGLEPDRARALLCSGRQRLARRGLSPEAAQALVDKFAALGIAAFAQAHGAGALPAQSAPQAAAPSVRRPEPMQPASGPETGAFNPYAAPRADLHSARRRDGDSRGIWRDIGRSVPAGHGIQWIKDAWRLVKSRPGMWLGALFLSFLCILMASMVAGIASFFLGSVGLLLGNAATALLSPVLAGGLAIMAHRHYEHEETGAKDVFAGFRQHCGALVLIGFLQLVANAALFLLSGRLTSMVGAVPTGFLCFILYLPVLAATIIAPALVAVTGRHPGQAMLQGIRASLANWLPVLVNAVVLTLFLLPFLLGLGGVFLIPVITAGNPGSAMTAIGLLALLLLILGMLLFIPLILIGPAMIYTAVRDIFYEET